MRSSHPIRPKPSSAAGRWRWRVALLLGLQAVALPAQAAILHLQNGLSGYTGTGDTYLEKHPTSNANNWNFGGSDRLVVFDRSARDALSLLRFDFPSLPGITAVNSATLYLTTAMKDVGQNSVNGIRPDQGRTVRLYRVGQLDQNWVEGNGQGEIVSGTSTYNQKQHGLINWSATNHPVTGNVAVGGVLASVSMAGDVQAAGDTGAGALNAFQLNSPTALAMLLDWIQNPENNAGFLLAARNVDEFFADNAFYSSEAMIQAYRPRLVLDVTVPVPEPATLLLLAPPLGLLLWRRRRGERSAPIMQTGASPAAPMRQRP